MSHMQSRNECVLITSQSGSNQRMSFHAAPRQSFVSQDSSVFTLGRKDELCSTSPAKFSSLNISILQISCSSAEPRSSFFLSSFSLFGRMFLCCYYKYLSQTHTCVRRQRGSHQVNRQSVRGEERELTRLQIAHEFSF